MHDRFVHHLGMYKVMTIMSVKNCSGKWVVWGKQVFGGLAFGELTFGGKRHSENRHSVKSSTTNRTENSSIIIQLLTFGQLEN